MKLSEFRKIIREEVRKVVKEVADPVQDYVEEIVDLAGSGSGESSGLNDPTGKKILDRIVKSIKAQNLMSRVDAAIVQRINRSSKGTFTFNDYFALEKVGFKMKGINENKLGYDH
jgi:hypothetical protein